MSEELLTPTKSTRTRKQDTEALKETTDSVDSVAPFTSQPWDDRAYLECRWDFKSLEPEVVLCGPIPLEFELPTYFEGLKYSFFGFKKVYHHILHPKSGQQIYKMHHRVFIAQLIEPPEHLITSNRTVSEEERFNHWKQRLRDDLVFRDYEQKCKDRGITIVQDALIGRIIKKVKALDEL